MLTYSEAAKNGIRAEQARNGAPKPAATSAMPMISIPADPKTQPSWDREPPVQRVPPRPISAAVRGAASAVEAVEAGVAGAIIGMGREASGRIKDAFANRTVHTAVHKELASYAEQARSSATAVAIAAARRFQLIDHSGTKWGAIAREAARGNLCHYTRGPSVVKNGGISESGGCDDADEWTKVMLAADLATEGFLKLEEALRNDRLPGCHWASTHYSGALGIGTRGASTDRQVCIVAHSINGDVPEQRMQGIFTCPNWVAVDKQVSEHLPAGTPVGWGSGSDEPFDGAVSMSVYSNSTKSWKKRWVKVDPAPEPGGFINSSAKAQMLEYVVRKRALAPSVVDGLAAASSDHVQKLTTASALAAAAVNSDRGHMAGLGFE